MRPFPSYVPRLPVVEHVEPISLKTTDSPVALDIKTTQVLLYSTWASANVKEDPRLGVEEVWR